MRDLINIIETAQETPGRLYYSGDPSEREAIMTQGLEAGAFFTADPQPQPGRDVYKVGMGRAKLSPVEGGWANESRIDQTCFVMLKDYGHDPSLVETDEFKRWFRGSRVIDGDSNPAVVHHFTQMDFEEFDDSWVQERFGRSADRFDAIGVWFTDNDGARYGTKRMDCYLRIRRPFWMDDIPGIGQDGECGYQLLKMMNEAGGARALRAKLIEQGHDGIIMTGTKLDMWEQNVFIIFHPSQVKSVRNRGTFDKRSNNIMEKVENPSYEKWWVNPVSKSIAKVEGEHYDDLPMDYYAKGGDDAWIRVGYSHDTETMYAEGYDSECIRLAIKLMIRRAFRPNHLEWETRDGATFQKLSGIEVVRFANE